MTVTIVSTGGTIASTSTSGGDASPSLDADDLVAAVPALEDVASIETRVFSNVPSPHIGIDRMYDLVTTLRELDAADHVDGIVVTHGTDSMEETATFVDLVYDGDATVVFTGAMRNPSLPSPDGPNNVLGSVRVAAAVDPPHNVFVALNDRVHLPRTVTKVHTMNPDTFRSPEFGPIGVVDEDRIVWNGRSARSQQYDVDPDALTNDVHALTITADMPPEQVELARGAAGLVIATMGAGHVPPEVVPPLQDVADSGVPIVATSRSPEGRLARETYGFHGSEQTLQDIGCYYSELNLQKARIKTIVALASGSLDDAFPRPS